MRNIEREIRRERENTFEMIQHKMFFIIIGADLAERGAQETSSILVETVQKISKAKQTGPVLPLFKSDASKVTSKGMGLKKAYLGKQNQFTVHASDAGKLESRRRKRKIRGRRRRRRMW